MQTNNAPSAVIQNPPVEFETLLADFVLTNNETTCYARIVLRLAFTFRTSLE